MSCRDARWPSYLRDAQTPTVPSNDSHDLWHRLVISLEYSCSTRCSIRCVAVLYVVDGVGRFLVIVGHGRFTVVIGLKEIVGVPVHRIFQYSLLRGRGRGPKCWGKALRNFLAVTFDI